MILEKLDINRGYSYKHQKEINPLQGTVTFMASGNKLEIELGEELSQKVIEVCAEAIVDASRKAAENMTAEIISQVPQIEEKS